MALSAAVGSFPHCTLFTFGKSPGGSIPRLHHEPCQDSISVQRNIVCCKPIGLAHPRGHDGGFFRKKLLYSPLTTSGIHCVSSPPNEQLLRRYHLRNRKSVISGSTSAGESLKGQDTDHQEQLLLTLSDVRLRLAPVEELIPVERRLPAPKEVGVYALVPAAMGQQVAPDGNPFGLQRMSQEDAMGFALGAATGKRSGPVDGPGWTLLDPATTLGANTFPAAGPLVSKSPRRTLRVEFTCNKCWERTVRAINPQAYKTGTVFVQCKGCNVYHKLVDNLNLFHELKGPIYSPPGQLFHTPYDPFKAKSSGGFDGLPFV